ncbi:MAG TPA: zf-HC2 domain-containing protein [Candidatus Binatus sp.]|nr:zf-HC2 domain-containing protein [Candidatus Binatus sp.]
MNCENVIHELSDFIDGDLDGALKQELESHLKDCEDCRLVVDQTKKTIEVFCDSEPVELPGEVRARLHDALRRKFKEAAH